MAAAREISVDAATVAFFSPKPSGIFTIKEAQQKKLKVLPGGEHVFIQPQGDDTR